MIRFLPYGLIIVFTIWLYLPALDNSLVSDSIIYLDNPHLNGLSMDNLYWMLTSSYFSNWHPLTFFSYALDYELYGGINARGYRFSNIIIHAINACLVFYLFSLMMPIVTGIKADAVKSDKQEKILVSCLIASLIFSAHPQRVESVVWIAERKDVLCMMFMLLTIIFYIFYQYKKRSRYYWLSVFFYVAAVMSKPMAVTIPAILVLLDVLIYRGSIINLRRVLYFSYSKKSYWVISAIAIYITVISQEESLQSIERIDFIERILNAAYGVLFYIGKFFVPVNLSPFYPHPFLNQNSDHTVYIVSLLVCFLLTIVFSVLFSRGHKPPLITWAFYLVALSPVIGLVQVGMQSVADRYSYLPTLPFYFWLAFGFYWLSHARLVQAYVLSIFHIALLSGLYFLTSGQITIWKNSLTLWSHAFSLYPDSGSVSGALGNAFTKYGYYEQAVRYFRHADEKNQLLLEALPRYAISVMETGMYEESIKINATMLAYSGHREGFYMENWCIIYNLSWAYYQQDKLRYAQAWFNEMPRKHRDNELVKDFSKAIAGERHPVDYCREIKKQF